MWGPVLFATTVPLLCAGVALALRVAWHQGRTEQRVVGVERDVRDLRDDLRALTHRLTGHPSPSQRRENGS